MYNTFYIFLASHDAASKVKFTKNNNMEFTIYLPQKYSLGKWEVCLKSMIIPSRIYNVYNEKDLHFGFSIRLSGVDMHMEPWCIIGKGYYELEDVLEKLNKHICKAGGPMTLKYDSI